MSGDDAKSSGGKIAIIVALIGLLGTLLPVLIVNWKTIFPKAPATVADTATTRTARVDTVKDTIKIGANAAPPDTASQKNNNDTAGTQKTGGKSEGEKKQPVNKALTDVSESNAAYSLTKQWYGYLITRKGNELLGISSLPFFGYRMIEDSNDLMGFYNRLFIKISGSVQPYNAVIINKVDLFNMYPQLKTSLHMAFEPYVVQMTLNNTKIFLLFQQMNTLKVVGCYVD